MKRLKQLFEMLPNVDTLVITSEKNRMYFTSFKSTFGYLLLNRKGNIFITDYRYYEMALCLTEYGIEVVPAGSGKMTEVLLASLNKYNTKTVGYEDTEMTVRDFENFKLKLENYTLVPVGKEIAEVRVNKTEEELQIITKAQEITDKTFSKILKFIKCGMSEVDIAIEMEHQIKLLGGDGTAFDTIIASGENSSKPHAHPTQKLLHNGDAVTIDFGARYKGYCSDMTRTFFIGEPSAKLLSIYNTVLNAQQLALNAIKPGVICNTIDKIARDHIAENGYGEYFTHNLGHGVGIDIHESPAFGMTNESILQPNTVITVEPGIYITGLGGVRIEDMVIVTKDGINDLTKSSKEIIIL